MNDSFDQHRGYNISVPVQYIIITNGNITYGWEKVGGKLKLLEEIPLFDS
jgi:hypothetical protein